MKRTLILILAFVTVLCVCMSAFAFTSTEWVSEAAQPFSLGIRLIDAEDGPLGVNFTAPAANRGYLKNEIVCAIATLYVPKGQDVAGRAYEYLQFSGVNMSINVTENRSGSEVTLRTSSNIPEASRVFITGSGGLSSSNEIRFAAGNIPVNASKDQEYHFAFFGKVVSDNAFMNVLLTKATEFRTPENGSAEADYITATGLPSDTTHLVFDGDYHVFRTVIDSTVYYTIANSGLTKPLFQVTTNKSGKSEGMYVYLADDDVWYEVVSMSGRAAFRLMDGSDFIMESDTGDRRTRYNSLITIYEDIAMDVFGLNIKYKGNSLPANYFTDYGSMNDLLAEVAIEPWYAEVNIPPEIEITAPKTGGAISAVGIALVVIAGLAAVAVRKVCAISIPEQ